MLFCWQTNTIEYVIYFIIRKQFIYSVCILIIHNQFIDLFIVGKIKPIFVFKK